MTFQESAQEIYQSMERDISSYLEYCKFVPNIDDVTLESDINRFAEKEEPAEIICIAKAKSTAGLMASLFGNTADNFLFTGQTLYIGGHSFKFSDIDSITYQEEIKTGLLGGQKKKTYLVVGKNEKFEGGLAMKAFAQLLDSIVKKNKENPPAKNPQKEFPRSKMIAESLSAANFPKFQTTSDLDEKIINSLIIHFGKSEPKASFIASYKKELFFSNDNLYSSVGEFKKIPYNQLGKAIYEENEKRDSYDEIIMEKKISLLSNNGKVFFENTNEIASKDVADFFNKIISDATGTEVKTEVKTAKREFPNIEIIIEECTKRNLKDYGWKTYADVDYNYLQRFISLNERKANEKAFAVGYGSIITQSFIKKDTTICFFNNAIYLGHRKIAYDQIGTIVCSKKFAPGNVKENVIVYVYDRDGKEVYAYDGLGGKNVASFFSDTIARITGAEVKIETTVDDTLALLNKWNEIFSKKKKDFMVDPEIKTETIEYVSKEERCKRLKEWKDGPYFNESNVKPKEIEVQQYSTDTAMIEIGSNETEVHYCRRPEPYDEDYDKLRLDLGSSKIDTLKKSEYYLKYYADKNNKDAYLLLRYDFEDYTLSNASYVKTKNFLKLEFKANGGGLCTEKELEHAGSVCLLDDRTLKNLERFVEIPYTLTTAERERREKLAKDKAEEERLQQEQDMKEKQQQHNATVNDLNNF